MRNVRGTPVRVYSPLPGATFADAFTVRLNDPALDAEAAARLIIERQPSWVSGLLRLRNVLVRPFGLNPGAKEAPVADSMGFFPVMRRSARQVLLGIDDRHLDFRLVVAVEDAAEGGRDVTVTTFVKTHNALGRVYLALVMPFHKLIVPTMLARVNAV